MKSFLFSILLLVFLSNNSAFAHRVESYTNSGCAAGQTMVVDAVITNAGAVTWYSWQYKTASGSWTCFVNGINNINGTNFTVSGAKSSNVANDAPALTIANITTALENVQVRVLMRDGAEPCGAPIGTVWGGGDLSPEEEKYLRLHVYANGTDCGATTPGCVGNGLVDANGYYGGFENRYYNAATSLFVDNNFITGAGSTEYTFGGSTSPLPPTSATGTYQVLQNARSMNVANAIFAPRTGNNQLVLQGSANVNRKAWYKQVSVIPGATYNFCAWAARTQGVNAFNIQLNINGVPVNTTSLSLTTGSWNQLCGSYTIPGGVTSVEICITDVATTSERFFALDDICFVLTSNPTPCAGTLLTNGGFENGLTGWSNGGNLTISSDAYTGIKSAMVPSGVFGGGSSTALAVTPGNVYTLSTFAKVTNPASVWAVVELQFFDASWNKIFAANKQVTATTYTSYSLTGVAPQGAAWVQAVMWKDVVGEMYTDEWCLTAVGSGANVGVGNFVFHDKNGNGIKDSQDEGIDGVSLKIYADNNDNGIADGLALDSTISSAGGFYSFGGLPAGKYFVELKDTWNSLYLSPINGGDPDNDIDNDNNGTSQSGLIIKGGTIQLSVGGEPGGLNINSTYDFGLFKNNGLGDYVWVDNNANGVQDTGEPGLAGVKVYLKNSSTNVVLDSTITNASGYYFFYDPKVFGTNTYNIAFVTPAGYSPSPANAGSDDTKDSDASSGVITNANVPNGIYNKTFDAGFVPLGSIGDYVWNDVNKNGIQDAGEPLLSNKTVILKNSGGTTLATIVSDASGKYLFSNLTAGDYQVVFPSVTGMFRASQNMGGANANNNSKAHQTTGVALVTIGIGENNMIIDAGYSIGVLTVKEINISPVLKGNEITVNWNTINEINTSYFEVERSYGNNIFETIGKTYTLVPNGGNGVYHIQDANFNQATATIMYRIKSVDVDGKESYSAIGVVKLKNKTTISVWPNPVVTSLNVSYVATSKSELKVNVYNESGASIMQQSFKVSQGTNQFTVNGFDTFLKGVYIVEIMDASTGEKQIKKIIKY